MGGRDAQRRAAWRAGAVSARARRAVELLFDRRYRVETTPHVYLEDLGVPPDERVWHDPSDWMAVRRALADLHVTRDDVFVDYGSGLGRGVLVAATLPFRRVIGLEISAELTARARVNLQHSRGRVRAAEVELVTADALEWPVPRDLTVAYLYCPFTGAVFDGVMQKLFESVDLNPRPLRIVYNYPLEHSRLLHTGRVRVLRVRSALWTTRSVTGPDVIVTYLVLPQDATAAAELASRFPQHIAGAEHWLGDYEPGYVLEKPARLGGVVLRRPRG